MFYDFFVFNHLMLNISLPIARHTYHHALTLECFDSYRGSFNLSSINTLLYYISIITYIVLLQLYIISSLTGTTIL